MVIIIILFITLCANADNTILEVIVFLRNVPDGRRDGLGHLTVYSKDYVLEYEEMV